MKRIRSVVEEYLENLGQLDTVKLGTEDKRQADKKDSDFFIQQLGPQLKINKVLIVLYITMICILFLISIFLVFYYLTSPIKMNAVLGGSFLGTLVILDKLRRLWKEKNMMDIILIVIRKLPPQETVKVIEILYWNSIHK